MNCRVGCYPTSAGRRKRQYCSTDADVFTPVFVMVAPPVRLFTEYFLNADAGLLFIGVVSE